MISIIARLAIITLLWANMPKAYASSCIDLMSGFLTAKPAITQTASYDSWALAEAKTLKMEDQVFRLLKEKLSTLKTKPSKEDFQSYLLFVDSLRLKNKLIAINELDKLGNPDFKSKVMSKHTKVQNIVKKGVAKEEKKLTKQIQKENPGIPRSDLDARVAREMNEFTRKYERLAYGCRSTKWTPERKAAAKSFKKFTIGIGMASSVGAYTYQNYDREFDGKWIGRLGYELTVGTLISLIASKIVSNPENTPITLSLKRYFLSRGTGLVDMFAYGALFGISDEEAQARLDYVMKDPNRKEEIRKLRAFMDEKNLYQKYKEKFFEKLKQYKESGVEVAGNDKVVEPISGKSLDWDELTIEDLQDEEIQSLLMTAILQQMYEEQKGDYIATGNAGSDRYAFHASYGLLMLPKDTFISLYIYNTLCMGSLNPKTAMIKAIGVFTLNRMIFDQVYYYVRRASINQ